METAAHMTSHSAAAINHPALAATHYWDHCEMPVAGVERHAALAPLAAAFNLGGGPVADVGAAEERELIDRKKAQRACAPRAAQARPPAPRLVQRRVRAPVQSRDRGAPRRLGRAGIASQVAYRHRGGMCITQTAWVLRGESEAA